MSLPSLWCRRRDLNPYRFLHTPLKRARLPFRHSDINSFYSVFNSWFYLRGGAIACAFALSSKARWLAFSSAECHSDINSFYSVFNSWFYLRGGAIACAFALSSKARWLAFSSAECHSDICAS